MLSILVNKNDTILLVNTNGNVIYNFGSSLGLDKINYIMEYNRSLIFQFHKTNDLEKCVEYNYNLNTKLNNIKADNLPIGHLIDKTDIHPVFLRLDSELADKSQKKG